MDCSQFPKPAEDSGEACISPFWSVGWTTEADEATMELVYRPEQKLNTAQQVDKMVLPVLRNIDKLEAGEKLLYYIKSKFSF